MITTIKDFVKENNTTPNIIDLVKTLPRDLDGTPIISGYDLANKIMESEPIDSVQYELANKFQTRANEIEEIVGDNDNPFVPENHEYAEMEVEFINNILHL